MKIKRNCFQTMRNIRRKHEKVAGHERIGKKIGICNEETRVFRKLENPFIIKEKKTL
jgi:hypothetical protein